MEMTQTQSSPSDQELRLRVAELERELCGTREELRQCREKLMFLESHPSILTALKGESLVASWVQGMTTGHNDSIDVNARGIRIEVKMSSVPTIAYKGGQTFRWHWPQILGVGRNKQFNRLILLGGKDERFWNEYLDSACPYVIFDIPYADLVPDQYGLLTQAGNAWDCIFLATNPQTVRRPGSRLLFTKYQTTVKELESNYGLK